MSILKLLSVEQPSITPSETGVRDGLESALPKLEGKDILPKSLQFESNDTILSSTDIEHQRFTNTLRTAKRRFIAERPNKERSGQGKCVRSQIVQNTKFISLSYILARNSSRTLSFMTYHNNYAHYYLSQILLTFIKVPNK